MRLYEEWEKFLEKINGKLDFKQSISKNYSIILNCSLAMNFVNPK